MNRYKHLFRFAVSAVVLAWSSAATMADEKKDLTFVAIATEEMAVVAEPEFDTT